MNNEHANRQSGTVRRPIFLASPGGICWYCQNRPLTHPLGVRVEARGQALIYKVCSLQCAAPVVEEISEHEPIVLSEDEIRDISEQQRPTLIEGLRAGPFMITGIPANIRRSEPYPPRTNGGEDGV